MDDGVRRSKIFCALCVNGRSHRMGHSHPGRLACLISLSDKGVTVPGIATYRD